LLLTVAATLSCGSSAIGTVIAVSNNESINYYSMAGAELGSTNFGVTIDGVATDSKGNIIVAQLNGGPVKLSGTTGSGSALPVGSSAPYYYGVAFDSSGNLYMTCSPDSGSASDIQVFKYSGDSGTPSLLTDTGSNGSYSVENTVAVDPVSGNIFVADYYNNIIYEYGPSGGSVPIATLTTDISHPFDLAIDSNENLYVTNEATNSLIKFTGETGTPTILTSNLDYAGGVTVDQDNDVFVTGFNTATYHGYISEYAPNGTLLSGTFVDLGYADEGGFITFTPVPEADGRLLGLAGAAAVMVIARKRKRSRLN
jgi:sugar lactone lactonase YvrE